MNLRSYYVVFCNVWCTLYDTLCTLQYGHCTNHTAYYVMSIAQYHCSMDFAQCTRHNILSKIYIALFTLSMHIWPCISNIEYWTIPMHIPECTFYITNQTLNITLNITCLRVQNVKYLFCIKNCSLCTACCAMYILYCKFEVIYYILHTAYYTWYIPYCI